MKTTIDIAGIAALLVALLKGCSVMQAPAPVDDTVNVEPAPVEHQDSVQQKPEPVQPAVPLPPPAPPIVRPEIVDWMYNYNDARKKGKELKRPVMVAFSRLSCSDCDKLARSVFEDEQSMSVLREKYVPLWWYSTPEKPDSVTFATSLGVTVWPKIALIAPDGSMKWYSPKPDANGIFHAQDVLTDLEKL